MQRTNALRLSVISLIAYANKYSAAASELEEARAQGESTRSIDLADLADLYRHAAELATGWLYDQVRLLDERAGSRCEKKGRGRPRKHPPKAAKGKPGRPPKWSAEASRALLQGIDMLKRHLEEQEGRPVREKDFLRRDATRYFQESGQSQRSAEAAARRVQKILSRARATTGQKPLRERTASRKKAK